MIFIRSLLFNIFMMVWTVFIGLAGAPYMLFSTHGANVIARWWGHGLLFAAKWLCGITHKIEGLENLKQDRPFIVAAKHQSAWDTIIFLTLLPSPVYVLKKELQYLPVYGQYLPRMRMIAVDRSGAASALKSMVKQAKERLSSGRTIVIFPEGTRTPAGKMTKTYHPGIAALYTSTGAPVVPAAVNSGLLWGRQAFTKKSGIITLRILPAIESGLDRKVFMQQLHTTIENNSKELL